jgi:hypothetical protein
LTANGEKLYSLILVQCTEHMFATLESLDDFKEIKRGLDVIKLMKAIKGVTYQFEGQKYQDEALHQEMKRFYLFNQNKDMTNAKFLETFQTLVLVITECRGEIRHNLRGILTALKEKMRGLASANLKELDEAKATSKERYLAVAMISACDNSRYNRLSEELENDYTKGSNHYPKTITEAYNLIVNYRQSKPSGRIYNDSEGVAFTNVDANRQHHDRQLRDIDKVEFYNCNKKGHYSNECPDKEPEKEKGKEKEKEKQAKEGTAATMMAEETSVFNYDNWEEFNFHQSTRKVNPAWILLDNCSTTDIFCNKKLLTNIQPPSTTLKIHCNAGTKEVNQVGTLKNYGTMWYSDSAIANILSFSQVKKKFPIIYDSKNENKFHVIKPDKHVVFKESESGLYYHDTTNRAVLMLNADKTELNTIKTNREGFTERDNERAKRARKALGLVGYPSPKYFKHMVSSNMIKNCPVTSIEVTNANKIFGPDLATLKGKTVRITPPPVATDYVQIPKEIMSLNRNITLTIDTMFVNGLPFMVSIYRKIKFTTVEYLLGRKQNHLVKSIIINLYKQQGFTIETALMDREFECLRADLPELNLNTTAASEHVPDVERQI